MRGGFLIGSVIPTEEITLFLKNCNDTEYDIVLAIKEECASKLFICCNNFSLVRAESWEFIFKVLSTCNDYSLIVAFVNEVNDYFRSAYTNVSVSFNVSTKEITCKGFDKLKTKKRNITGSVTLPDGTVYTVGDW